MLWTLGYAVWWALGGWVLGLGIDALFGTQTAVILALINVIAGLLLLLPVVADAHMRRLFYEGPRPAESSELRIGLLWVFPTVGLSAGLVWWVMSRFM
jgi:hypothetical protein